MNSACEIVHTIIDSSPVCIWACDSTFYHHKATKTILMIRSAVYYLVYWLLFSLSWKLITPRNFFQVAQSWFAGCTWQLVKNHALWEFHRSNGYLVCFTTVLASPKLRCNQNLFVRLSFVTQPTIRCSPFELTWSLLDNARIRRWVWA